MFRVLYLLWKKVGCQRHKRTPSEQSNNIFIRDVWFEEMNKTRDTCPMSPCLSANIRRALWEYSLGVGTWLSHSELQNPISHRKPPQHVSFMSKQNNLKCSTGIFYYSQCSFICHLSAKVYNSFYLPSLFIMFCWWILFLTYLSIRLIRIK